jgi:hypothetical protein
MLLQKVTVLQETRFGLASIGYVIIFWLHQCSNIGVYAYANIKTKADLDFYFDKKVTFDS